MDIAKQIEDFRQMKVSELVERYVELFGKSPRSKNRDRLWKRCAWKLQEHQFGGLSRVAKRRLEELIAEIDLPLPERTRSACGVVCCPQCPEEPKVGVVLVRKWKGREVRATRVDSGWLCEGAVYRSLTAAARAVTGSGWNGRLFFGLTERKRKKA